MGNVKPTGAIVFKNADERYEYGPLFQQLALVIFCSQVVALYQLLHPQKIVML